MNDARLLPEGKEFTLVEFDLEGMPKLERAAPAPKEKKAKKADEGKAVSKEAAPVAVAGKEEPAPPAQQSKKEKKAKEAPAQAQAGGEKSEQKPPKEKKAKTPAPTVAESTGPVPSMIDLRVGRVLEGELLTFVGWVGFGGLLVWIWLDNCW